MLLGVCEWLHVGEYILESSLRGCQKANDLEHWIKLLFSLKDFVHKSVTKC